MVGYTEIYGTYIAVIIIEKPERVDEEHIWGFLIILIRQVFNVCCFVKLNDHLSRTCILC